MIRTQGLLMIAAPTSPAVVPSARKITERPALKASELRITARRLASRPAFFQLIDADARHQRDVARHERQHARRKKRKNARDESDADGYV